MKYLRIVECVGVCDQRWLSSSFLCEVNQVVKLEESPEGESEMVGQTACSNDVVGAAATAHSPPMQSATEAWWQWMAETNISVADNSTAQIVDCEQLRGGSSSNLKASSKTLVYEVVSPWTLQ